MKHRWPFSHADQTRFIVIDTHRCKACAACVQVCQHHVLGMVAFLWHRHARLDDPDACTGCRRCVAACPHGAITRAVPHTLDPREKRAS
jgi:2-oxoglutarate ferredoxin oxidoreductase subunit delta